ncbi:hypothetical protein J1N35_043318 [Gossypium stocksii]|uniref:Uncharacterized protein n=1 Tax=Gossypium stocksii TaxID=47602 RepID=A0A9D3ZEW4_9ROSI|nr:hypothetical protein J1N35_043318 [Gossypium stocksii]
MAEKMKRSGNSRSRRMTYVKRRESVLKVEDIFLRYLDHNDNIKSFLYESLKCLKYEAEILDKLGRYHALERKLADLNWKTYEAENKMRSYNSDMTKILTISEADLHQQFVMDAILQIEKLKMSSSTTDGAASSGTQRDKILTQLADDHNDENIEQPEPSASEDILLKIILSESPDRLVRLLGRSKFDNSDLTYSIKPVAEMAFGGTVGQPCCLSIPGSV